MYYELINTFYFWQYRRFSRCDIVAATLGKNSYLHVPLPLVPTVISPFLLQTQC